MVGQTQQRQYRYYRCRSAYAGPKHERCESKYVRADELELAVREAAARVLAEPQMVLAEVTRALEDTPSSSPDPQAVAVLEQRRERVLRLFELGEIDETRLTGSLRELDAERERLSSGHAGLPPAHSPKEWSAEELETACAAVREWIESADGDDLQLLLDALEIRVDAATEGSVLHGVIPSSAPVDEYADVRAVVTAV